MSIIVEIKLVSDGKDGIDIEYTSIPGENVTMDEVDVSNAIIALCDLLDDQDFNNRMGDLMNDKLKLIKNPRIDLIM